MGGIFWFAFGGGKRYRGACLIAFAALLLAITAMAASAGDGPGLPIAAGGIAISAGLGWLGYRVQRRAPREPSADPLLAALLDATPTTRSLQPQDVVGHWRFYIDAATATVTIDLQTGGRYEQQIVGTSGKQSDGPGGEWTLDGANLELSAYRSIARNETGRAAWFFGDSQGDLILFVKDDPQTEAMLLARRVETSEKCHPLPSSGDFGAAQPSRKAASRSPSLFVSYGRFGHGGRPAR
jgi:hypothetical protein